MKKLLVMMTLVCAFQAAAQTDQYNNLQPARPVRWLHWMAYFGSKYCDQTLIHDQGVNGSRNEGIYMYDGAWVYYQIADLWRDSNWEQCAEWVTELNYRPYVLDNNGALPGYRVHTHGLYEDWKRHKDTASRDAVCMLANNSAYAYPAGDPDPLYARETAFILQAYLHAEKIGICGENYGPKMLKAVGYLKGHMQQWRRYKELQLPLEAVQPFIMALAAHALIEYDTAHPGDPAIRSEIKKTFDWLWAEAPEFRGSTALGSCLLLNLISGEKAPDLNLMIAPIYYWLAQQTAQIAYLNIGDALFNGGVPIMSTPDRGLNWFMPPPNSRYCCGADLSAVKGKVFSQNYRLSILGEKWRSQALGRMLVTALLRLVSSVQR